MIRDELEKQSMTILTEYNNKVRDIRRNRYDKGKATSYNLGNRDSIDVRISY